MSVTNRLKNQHLLWRAGFGPMAENDRNIDSIAPKELWSFLLKNASQKPEPLNVATNTMQDNLYEMSMQGGDDQTKNERRRAIQKQYREDLKALNLRWLSVLVESKDQLREKMSFFWHGHFACRIFNIHFQQELLQVIRTQALGNFGDLLKSVSKSPAMLQYLNNQQNRKQKPNENFAREVMELFTMGRGNYTETDVKEAARAFTGWGFNAKSEFVFRANQHDAGSKTFLGKTGNFDGDDILNMLLEQKQTAIFITKKIYRFFVNEQVNEAQLTWLANRFYRSGYAIDKLMEDIFTSEWFYDKKNIGTKIKSPVELLVGIRRILPMQLKEDSAQLLFQRALGQELFYPPNVSGWAGGKNWIDSSTLMLRLRIPQIITANEAIQIQAKSDDDVMMGQMAQNKMREQLNKSFGSKAAADVDWVSICKAYNPIPREQLLAAISSSILQTTQNVSPLVLDKYLNKESRELYIKSALVYVMSTPEYQLC